MGPEYVSGRWKRSSSYPDYSLQYSHYWYEARIADAKEQSEKWRSFKDGKLKEMVAATLAELSKGADEGRILKEHADKAAADLRKAARYPADS